jgi:phasin family protein
MLNTEQIVAAQQANVQTLLGLTRSGFETVEKLVELNLRTVKAALAEAGEAAVAVKDPQQLLEVQNELLQSVAQKAASYGRQVYDIAAANGAVVSKVAEASAADAQRTMIALVDTVVKNAPAGSENAVALVKSAVAAANNAYDTVQKAAKQATVAAETNFAAFNASAQMAMPAAGKGKRAA